MEKECLANATLAFAGHKKAKQKVQELEYEREELLKAIGVYLVVHKLLLKINK